MGNLFEYKIADIKIERVASVPDSLFGETVYLPVDPEKSERVVKGIIANSGRQALQQAYSVFLSEINGAENLVLRFVQYILAEKGGVNNHSHEAVHAVQQISKKVSRERHRMKAFIRFSLGKDGLYYAGISPDFNILPLIAGHFKDRYADQRWLIYDLKRNYGLHYDLHKVEEVQLTHLPTTIPGSLPVNLDSREGQFQLLWQQYFKSINIKERKNTRLHLQHVPRRYWRYLTEKWDFDQ